MNRHEMFIGTGFCSSACLWAYIIGNACSILSALGVETTARQQLMDS